jgi:TPR repeat protein
MKNQRLIKINGSNSQQTSENNVALCKLYMELDKLCYLAVTVEEQVLLVIPKEDRIEFSETYAPFNPENLSCWQKAANLGILNGCYLFGKCLLNSGQIEKGLYWLRIAASKDNEHAKTTLGVYLLERKKHDEGLQLLQQAAEAGYAYACEILAHMYADGDGVPKSKSKFSSYMKLAAQFGSHSAALYIEADEAKPFWQRWLS